jgi:hypothetical protein
LLIEHKPLQYSVDYTVNEQNTTSDGQPAEQIRMTIKEGANLTKVRGLLAEGLRTIAGWVS